MRLVHARQSRSTALKFRSSPAVSDSRQWIPYRGAQPAESPPELVVPAVIPEDERVWVLVDGGYLTV